MQAIVNCKLVFPDGIREGNILMEDGKIVAAGDVAIPEGAEILDARGAYAGPGLVDIHCHAGNGVRFEHDPIRAAQMHLPYGTTSMLATIGGRLSGPELVKGLNNVREAIKLPGGANIAGVYMEGPYMNPDFGSLRHLNPWRGAILAEDYDPVIEAAGDMVHVWMVGPEREGIEAFVKAAKKVNPNVKFAVGHSQASPAQIEALIPYGLCIGTHHTNATGDLPKYPECRGVCVDETVNYNNSIYAELICDYWGIHVDPYMLRLVRKIKGDDKIILITDHTAYSQKDTAEIPPEYSHITDLNFTPMENGGIDISGSKLTLNAACRNYMKHTGASIVDAFKVASYNPAKVTGLDDRGEIREGLRADLIFVDHKMNVSKVILAGKVVNE